MNDKDIYAHKAVASSMNRMELCSIIQQIFHEKTELEPFLPEEELEKYDIVINIYSEQLEWLYSLNSQNNLSLIH